MPYIEFTIPSDIELNTLLINGWMRLARPGKTEAERQVQKDILLRSYLGMQAYDALWGKNRLLSPAEALDLTGDRPWALEALCGALVNRPSLLHRLGDGRTVNCSHDAGCADGYDTSEAGFLICC